MRIYIPVKGNHVTTNKIGYVIIFNYIPWHLLKYNFWGSLKSGLNTVWIKATYDLKILSDDINYFSKLARNSGSVSVWRLLLVDNTCEPPHSIRCSDPSRPTVQFIESLHNILLQT
jgi:hypothetical protein